VTASGGGWSIQRRAGTAHTLHEPWPLPAERPGRIVTLCAVRGPRTVVLGSAQRDDVVDLGQARRRGVDVVHRSSGGAAVLVGPAEQVWLEAWIPRGDVLWDDDVISSSWWLGETWKRALETMGAPGLRVHRGRATRTDWSDVVCFAGVGPGEVTAGGAKAVGVAQRRTRLGARLYSMAPLSWDPAPLLAVLALDRDRTCSAHDALGEEAIGVRAILPPPWRGADADSVVRAVEDALLAALP
jgi:hypothetical protein